MSRIRCPRWGGRAWKRPFCGGERASNERCANADEELARQDRSEADVRCWRDSLAERREVELLGDVPSADEASQNAAVLQAAHPPRERRGVTLGERGLKIGFREDSALLGGEPFDDLNICHRGHIDRNTTKS